MKQKLVETINRSWNSLLKHRKAVLMVGFFVLVLSAAWILFGPQAAWAKEPVPAGAVDGSNPAVLSKEFWIGLFVSMLLALARLCLSLTLFIMTFIIQVAGYNGYLDSPAVTVGWVMVRDITNMGFVVILLVIAFGTILGLEHYEWKKMLVKLVMAAVLVNFSRTICGVFIDIAQVVMVTFVNGIAATAGGNLIQMFNLDNIRELSTSTDPQSFNSLNFFVAGVMALVFSATVMFTMAIFLVMLLARMIVLWVLIVLSPFAFVLSILPQTETYANQWWQEFGKNVITGPVLLFFVWLAFVTAGNGKINEEIADKNITGITDTGAEANQMAGQTSGIGSAMDWNNMANFAIAIGMLVVGSRAASQLGGFGGEWAGQAVNFGKKVGMYASGLNAARYLGKKGAELAINKFPVIGKESLLRKAGVIGDRLSILKGKTDEWRNENINRNLEKSSADIAAKKRELKRGLIKKEDYDKWMKDKGYSGGLNMLGRLGKRRLSAFIETSGRSDKRAEDWKKAAESQHEIVEETYGTSKLSGGLAKLELGVRAHQIKEFAEGKRRQKYGEEEQQLMAQAHHEIEPYLDQKSELEKELKAEKITESQFKEKMEEVEKERQKARTTFGQREEATFESMAAAEYTENEIRKNKEIEIGKAKDADLIKKGIDLPRYETAVRAKHQKELEDLTNTLNYRESSRRNQIYLEQKIDLEKRRDATDETRISLEEFDEQMLKLQDTAATTFIANLKRGSETGNQALDDAMKHTTLEINGQEIGGSDLKAMQNKILSMFMLKKVTDAQAELEVYAKKHGEEKTQVMLRSLDEATKKFASEGNVMFSGWLDDSEVNPKTGKINFKLQTDVEEANKTREYFAQTTPPAKVITLRNMVTSSNDGVTKDAEKIDNLSVKNFITVFRRVTKGTIVDGRLVKEWENMDKNVKKKLIDSYQKETNPNQATILREKLEGKQAEGPIDPSSPPGTTPPPPTAPEDESEYEEGEGGDNTGA